MRTDRGRSTDGPVRCHHALISAISVRDDCPAVSVDHRCKSTRCWTSLDWTHSGGRTECPLCAVACWKGSENSVVGTPTGQRSHRGLQCSNFNPATGRPATPRPSINRTCSSVLGLATAVRVEMASSAGAARANPIAAHHNAAGWSQFPASAGQLPVLAERQWSGDSGVAQPMQVHTVLIIGRPQCGTVASRLWRCGQPFKMTSSHGTTPDLENKTTMKRASSWVSGNRLGKHKGYLSAWATSTSDFSDELWSN